MYLGPIPKWPNLCTNESYTNIKQHMEEEY